MKFGELMACAGVNVPGHSAEIEVTAITADSRHVSAGTLFVAISGTRTDSHRYIADAVEAGAVAVVGEQPDIANPGVPYIAVPRARETLARLAHAHAGYPTRRIRLIGITGTNGKTSSARLCSSVLEAAGEPCATFGTIAYDTGAASHEAGQTTPDPVRLVELIEEAVDAGCRAVCLEASSHALDQDRVVGVDFDIAVFTNLSQDHLDYHEDVEKYFRAKLKLFELLNDSYDKGLPKCAVLNIDDPRSVAIATVAETPVLRYGFGPDAEIMASDVAVTIDGTRFRVETPSGACSVRTRLIGRHNVLNVLAALAVSEVCGISLDTAAAAAEEVVVPGRFESVNVGQGFTVVVDYAHTDDGLRNLLKACREITKSRVIVVFGCGGDRDRTKRPKMGQVVGEMADFAVLTTDNPRNEDPVRIALDAEVGLERAGWHKGDEYEIVLDRREAIAEAVSRAKEGDVVAIAGKGHEPYQIVGTDKFPFDDRSVAREILEQRI